MTYTYAILDISREAYEEIAAKLREAGYDQAFHEGILDTGSDHNRYVPVVVIDMHGIALRILEKKQ